MSKKYSDYFFTGVYYTIIARLMNNSVMEIFFPSDLKLTEVSSLFKRKPFWMKLIIDPWVFLLFHEKASSLQLTDDSDNIFAALLSAWHKGCSCQSMLWDMTKHFKCVLDRGEYITCMSIENQHDFLLSTSLLNYVLIAFIRTSQGCMHLDCQLIIST